MSHTHEQSRPEHQIMEHHIPTGHAHLDQKYDKGMRSPMASQLPDPDVTLGTPETAPGLGSGEGGM